jgi:hypothetical protein
MIPSGLLRNDGVSNGWSSCYSEACRSSWRAGAGLPPLTLRHHGKSGSRATALQITRTASFPMIPQNLALLPCMKGYPSLQRRPDYRKRPYSLLWAYLRRIPTESRCLADHRHLFSSPPPVRHTRNRTRRDIGADWKVFFADFQLGVCGRGTRATTVVPLAVELSSRLPLN